MRSDEQLSEGFESTQPLIQHNSHPTTTTFSQRPTDFQPRVILRSKIYRKLPDAANIPVPNIPLHISDSTPGRKMEECRETVSLKEAYEGREEYRLVYSKYEQNIFREREDDFTGRQLSLKNLIRYQEQNYSLLRPYDPPHPSPSGRKIVFDSRFQCGNLLCAYQSLASPCEFHLFMENDTNRFGYNQWFFFSLRGVQSGVTYRFKLLNFRKPSSFFRQGMKPIIFSLAKHQRSGNGWWKGGGKVVYGSSPVHDIIEGVQCKLYCLSFDLRFTDQDDFITISSGLPYSYSRLCSQLKEMKGIGLENGLEWSQRTIAYTLSNNQVPYLIIRKEIERPIIKSKKRRLVHSTHEQNRPIILVLARQHPGETHSSYIMQQFLRELATIPNKQTQNLLEEYQFHIFPMINVDGVIYGNFRCDLAGFDLNRTWRSPLKEVHPQIQAIADKVRQLGESHRVAFCLDLHSHSKQLGVFSYCCKEEEVQSRVFPLMLAKSASDLFLFPSCTFGISRDKFTTARAVISSIIKNPNVLTIQASSYGVKNQQNSIVSFEPTHFRTFVRALIETLSNYLQGGKLKIECENEVKAKINEFQAYDGQNKDISGSDSEGEGDPLEIIKNLRKLLPESTVKKLEGKCDEVEQQRRAIPKKDAPPPSPKQTSKSMLHLTEPPIQTIPVQPQRPQSKGVYVMPKKPEGRKQEVLAILRTKDTSQPQPQPQPQLNRRPEELQPVIRMPINSFKVNLARYQQNKTQNAVQKEKDEFLTEDEAKLLERRPAPKKNRSSLIIGSSRRDAMKTTGADLSHFKVGSFDEADEYEQVGVSQHRRRMSKIEKILRLRKRHNTFKNLVPQERANSGFIKVELKIGEQEHLRTEPQRVQSTKLKANKSSITVNRDPQRKRVPRAIMGIHPNAQTSLIGQLWRMNYGRYSKELAS